MQLEIIGVKKNPNGQAYTGLGVVTKGALLSAAARRLAPGAARSQEACPRANPGCPGSACDLKTPASPAPHSACP